MKHLLPNLKLSTTEAVLNLPSPPWPGGPLTIVGAVPTGQRPKEAGKDSLSSFPHWCTAGSMPMMVRPCGEGQAKCSTYGATLKNQHEALRRASCPSLSLIMV